MGTRIRISRHGQPHLLPLAGLVILEVTFALAWAHSADVSEGSMPTAVLRICSLACFVVACVYVLGIVVCPRRVKRNRSSYDTRLQKYIDDSLSDESLATVLGEWQKHHRYK